jgi:uncharacterized repeat protein (TIGR03803 family)
MRCHRLLALAFFPLTVLLTLTLMFLPAVLLTQSAQAQTHRVLYGFTGGADGANPMGSLLMDKAGNLYGTTEIGGALGFGTVFKLDATGNETVLHSFTYFDGAVPYAGLVMDKTGNLYGTTAFGGPFDAGTAFKLGTSGEETVLYGFSGGTDGEDPEAGLVMDMAGNLYGTTYYGGAFGFGTVFQVDPSGNEMVLHNFTKSDGANPDASLVMDKRGDLYGTTEFGGSSGVGTLFKLTRGGNYDVLYSFTNMPDGEAPQAGLVVDKAGNFWGTTNVGGSSGFGTVFKLGTSGNEMVLHSFTNVPDGAYPMAGLVMDEAGNLYGTTREGGSFGFGTVFKLGTSGNETVLHSFTYSDGAYPYAGLVMDKAGNLYGTTNSGGTFGYGTVFKLTPARSNTKCSISFATLYSHNQLLYRFTANVEAVPSATGFPTGQVTFWDSAYSEIVLGRAALINGKASLTVLLSPEPNPQWVKAVYKGDSNFKGCESPYLAIFQ